jgi:hypothetical protein
MALVNLGRAFRVAAVSALLLLNYAVPTHAVRACASCEWCWTGSQWTACCPYAASGGWSSCVPHAGDHCDVGPPCAAD